MNPYQERRNKLFTMLEPLSILLLHSGSAPHKSHDEMYEFYPNMNFYYLTGIKEDNTILMIVKEEQSVQEFLFVQETTPYMKQWVGEHISKQEASDVTGIPITQILWLKQFEDFFHNTMNASRLPDFAIPKTLYVDMYHYKKELPSHASMYFPRQINDYKELTIRNISEQLTVLRMIKDDLEIEELKKAIHITNQGIKRIMRELHNRTHEYQLEADFLHQIRIEGSTHIAFQTIAASGANATVLHYEKNNSELQDGDLILFDLGAKYNFYSADISRTFPINGTFTKRQKDIYNLVLKANKETIKAVKPGLTWAELNKIPRDILEQGAKDLGILLENETIQQYYYHSIGHFLGLDTHDVGAYGNTLQEGMVITIEPGLYIKKENIGVRVEDNILVTKEGCVNLSKDIIKEVDDIEQFMKF
jgi:Xaa-Pro aminopeptidase